MSPMQKVTLDCDDTTAIQIRRGAHAPGSCSSPDVLIRQDCKRILEDGASLRLLLYRLKRLVTHHSGAVSYRRETSQAGRFLEPKNGAVVLDLMQLRGLTGERKGY